MLRLLTIIATSESLDGKVFFDALLQLLRLMLLTSREPKNIKPKTVLYDTYIIPYKSLYVNWNAFEYSILIG